MKSPRTTITGILSILAALASAGVALFDGNAATNPDWGAVGAAIMAGIGLITARDNNVTSEQAGAIPPKE